MWTLNKKIVRRETNKSVTQLNVKPARDLSKSTLLGRGD